MKKILFFILILLPLKMMGQTVPFEMGAIKVDSIYLNESSDWVDELNTSTTLSGATDKQVPSALAVKTFVMDTVPQIIKDSIDAIDLTTTSLQDSIDTHTDSLQLHNDRLLQLEQGGTGYTITVEYDASPDTAMSYKDGSFGYYLRDAINEADSVYKHTDSLQLHNTRLKALETDSHTHDNSAILDATTASYTTALNTRLAGVNDTILVVIKVTEDTTTNVEVRTGYILPISRTLAGCNLYRAEAFSPDNGNGVVALNIYRNRGGSAVTVTTTGADIDGMATINTSYDDVALSDYYDFGYVETGASTYTIGIDVYLTFLRP